ncbi:MAG: hypothetical protein HZA50_08260 [Planctomycetes bacterium]|nr:hypothetical protein [Planctomycetota bacterium]
MSDMRLTTCLSYLGAGIIFFGTACTADAQNVRVDVAAGDVISEEVPRVLRYSGNIWWTPEVFVFGVAEKILDMEHPGMMRISLGDQILQYAGGQEDLQKRLEQYPLNKFLSRYAAAGGKVLFILDTVPFWISSNKSREKLPDPNTQIFRMSPPADYQAWSGVVEAIVRHFNGKLGLNAYYESWNEPSWYYLGTTDEYLKQYYHSVLGARRADPRALIGGPCVSEFNVVATRGTKQNTDEEKADILKKLLEQQYFFKQFLDYAGRTGIPELGLKKLPVDFFSWHSYYVDPSNYYGMVVPVIRDSLIAAGYPRTTPLFNTEWNIAAVPPYPEGNINATEVGAAFVAASLMAMHESGVDGQIFQMYVDPSAAGYFGGTFTFSGIPRANYNTFRLFSMLKGKQLSARTADPWVKSAAFSDGSKVYLMVSTFVPTPNMLATTLKIQSALDNAQFTKSIVKEGLVESLAKGRELPEPFAAKAKEIAEGNKKLLEANARKAAEWGKGVTLNIALSGMKKPPGKVTRYLIDSKHSNIYPDLEKIEKTLFEKQKQNVQAMNDKTLARLQEAGVGMEDIGRFRAELSKNKSPGEAIGVISPEKREAAAKAVEQPLREYLKQHKELLDSIGDSPSSRIHEETITWPSSGRLEIRAEPHSVQLFVFDP